MDTTTYKVAIIGGGTAGVLALSEVAAKELYPIVWIDPDFH
jgi:cation diffusion facilitator CzcD-associated flavoprotein CzcO